MNAIKTNDFGREVLQSEMPVLVDFFATWLDLLSHVLASGKTARPIRCNVPERLV
jgi:hypothetical protein